MRQQVILFTGSVADLRRLCQDIRENMAEDIPLVNMFK